MVSRNRTMCSQTRSRRTLPNVLQILARLEPDGPAGRDTYFLARPRVTTDAALAWLHLEDAEPAELDALAALHRDAHRVEHRVDGDLSLHLGNLGRLRHLVDDVYLDH